MSQVQDDVEKKRPMMSLPNASSVGRQPKGPE